MSRYEELVEVAEGFLAAWNTHDVEQVLACYTADVVYRDPNTDDPIRGAAAFGRYLSKLFAQWEMHWELVELFPFEEPVDGAAVIWRATLAPRDPDGGGSEREVTVRGMDLALLEGGRLCRNDVYFDRMALASLLAG